MPHPENYIRCEKCWRPAFQLPCGTIFLVYPRMASQPLNEKYAYNLCIAHLRVLREWIEGRQLKLPKAIPNQQTTLILPITKESID